MTPRAPEPHVGKTKSSGPARRGFLTGLLAALSAGLALLAPLCAGLVALLHPLRRRRTDADLVFVTTFAGLPPDGTPRKFPVVADRVDAWNNHAATPVGAVYLLRSDNTVKALNVACPHAGCFVTLAPNGSRFVCPCHKSSFDLDGRVNDPASPSPRDLDVLDVEIRGGDQVWVRFQNFRPGRPDKTPVA